MTTPNLPSRSEAFGHGHDQVLDDNVMWNAGRDIVHVEVNQYFKGNLRLPKDVSPKPHPTFKSEIFADSILDDFLEQSRPSVNSLSQPLHDVTPSRNPFKMHCSYPDIAQSIATDAEFQLWSKKSLEGRDYLETESTVPNDWSSRNSSLVSLISSHDSDFLPSELTSKSNSSCEIYVQKMLSHRRGYPLYTPQPDRSLPVENRRNGTSIGDVVIITQDGGLDYLFNPLLPSNDPRNPDDLYSGFDDTARPDIKIHRQPGIFNSKSNIYSSEIECYTDREHMELSVSCSGNDGGAILFMPDGASQEDFKNARHLSEFIAENATKWYYYAIDTAGRDIDRNSLYFVTGCMKAESWGIATFDNTVSKRAGVLKLGRSTHPRDPRYIWERTSGAIAKAGPVPDDELDIEGHPSQNQCLFIRGFKIALSEEAWADVLKGISCPVTNQPGQGSKNCSFRDVYSMEHSPKFGENQAPLNTNASSDPTLRNNRTVLNSFPSITNPFHPSDVINNMLLNEIPFARVAVTHDDEWCEISDEYDVTNEEMLIQGIKSKYRSSFSTGAAVLNKIKDNLSIPAIHDTSDKSRLNSPLDLEPSMITERSSVVHWLSTSYNEPEDRLEDMGEPLTSCGLETDKGKQFPLSDSPSQNAFRSTKRANKGRTTKQLQSGDFIDLYTEASDLPPDVWKAMRSSSQSRNIMLPQALKNSKTDKHGDSKQIWMVYSSTKSEPTVELILTCTNGPMGNYPIFITTTHSPDKLTKGYLISRLHALIQMLRDVIPVERVYSVFAPDLISKTFASLWIELNERSYKDPNFAQMTFCTKDDSFRNLESPVPPDIEPALQSASFNSDIKETVHFRNHGLASSLPPDMEFELRLAGVSDTRGIAHLCHLFASDSDPFSLTPDGEEALEKTTLLAQRRLYENMIIASSMTCTPFINRARLFTIANDMIKHLVRPFNPEPSFLAGDIMSQRDNNATTADHCWIEIVFERRKADVRHW